MPTFLLVDDDEHKRVLLGIHLKRAFPGYDIVECSSGAEGIDAFDAHPVDAIVTDHSMTPVSGIEMIRAIRKRDTRVPIVMVTGHPSIRDVAVNAGADAVIGFVKFAELPAILTALLGRKHT